MKRYKPKYLNKEKKRRGFSTSALLVYLLIAVTLTTGVSFSRYTSTASGSASARVAKFEVSTHANDGQSISLADGADTASGSYVFTVSSASEVSVSYDVVVSWKGDWPTGVTLALDNGTEVTPSGNSHTFADAGSFAPNLTDPNSHTLILKASDFSNAVVLSDITVEIIASQVD